MNNECNYYIAVLIRCTSTSLRGTKQSSIQFKVEFEESALAKFDNEKFNTQLITINHNSYLF